MFQLIAVTLAVALAVSLSLGAVYYGGKGYVTSSSKSRYATYQEQGAQIKGGVELMLGATGFSPSGSSNAQFNALVANGFLGSIPSGDASGNWFFNNQIIYHPLSGTVQCSEINQVANMNVADAGSSGGCPSCADANYANWPACQNTTPILPQDH